MKSRHLTYLASALCLAAALYGFAKCGSGDKPVNPRLPDKTGYRRSGNARPEAADPQTHVIFPGLAPMPYSDRKSVLLKELARPHGPFEDIGSSFRDAFELEKVEILTDPEGRIALIEINAHLLPSVSRKSEVLGLFKGSDVEIVRLGNPVANVNSKLFMQALIRGFEFGRCLRMSTIDGNGGYADLPTGPHVIQPITYIDRRHEYGKPPADVSEKYGLLWMSKCDSLPDGRAHTRWEYDIPIQDCRWVTWEILPLTPCDKAEGWWQVIGFQEAVNTPDFTFERKIRLPDDPPDKPLPPPSTSGPRSGPPPLTEPDPPSTE